MAHQLEAIVVLIAWQSGHDRAAIMSHDHEPRFVAVVRSPSTVEMSPRVFKLCVEIVMDRDCPMMPCIIIDASLMMMNPER